MGINTLNLIGKREETIRKMSIDLVYSASFAQDFVISSLRLEELYQVGNGRIYAA